jgi:hypothetical protein
MKSIGRLKRNIWIWPCLFIFLAWQARDVWAADVAIRSKWDENLLAVELGDVSVKANNMAGAWQEMTTKYLLRMNLYMDATLISYEKPFDFHKEKATGKDVLDGFLATYSSYTYTQNPETGIIWIYPKGMNYNGILNQKVSVIHKANHVPMYTDIYIPLCKLLAPGVIDSSDLPSQEGRINLSTGKSPIPYFWLYDVDLPTGDYSAREILDFCCVANPTKAFLIRPASRELNAALVIFLKNLLSPNPLAPPRAEAIRFWEFEIGESTNGIPSLEEVRVAMSDPNPEKRSAASFYLEASMLNYSTLNLIGKADGSDQAVWTSLGVEYALRRDANTNFFTRMMQAFPSLREDLKEIRNPDLALLASLQLTREQQDTSYLDAIVSKHTYTEEEIISIKPELTRMARSSKAVRDKLKEMKSQVAELSPEALDELADTKFFRLVPVEKN